MRCTISILSLLAWTASAATGNRQQCNVKSLRVAKVVTPDATVLYDESRTQWASKLGSKSFSDFMLRPDAIVYCESDQDVVDTVAFASRCGYSISVRSGGHQYSGYSSCKKDANKCIQVDVSSLDMFAHDAATDKVTIGAGLVLEKIIGQLVPLGLVVPMGLCNTVAAGGHFQTSASGTFIRPFGLGMDHVKSFRIVTADAQILTVTPTSSHPDLYKAVLGGGPGSFGIVLDYTVQAIRSDAYPNSAYAVLAAPYTRATYDIVLPLFMEIEALPEYARDLMTILFIGVLREGEKPDPVTNLYQHYIILMLAWAGVDNTGSFVGDGHYANTFQRFLDTGLFATVFDGPLPLHGIMDQSRFDFDFGSDYYYVEQFGSEQPYSPQLLAQIGDEIDTFLARIPNVRLSFQFQQWGGTGQGSGYNQNTGLNAYPTRKVFLSNDNWVFFPATTDDDGLQQETQVRTIMTNFSNQRTQLVSPAGLVSDVKSMWLTTNPLTAHTADLSKDWPDYFPNQEAFAYVQNVKQQYDPHDVFSTDMTIPLPK